MTMRTNVFSILAIGVSMFLFADAAAAATINFGKAEYMPPKIEGNQQAKAVKGNVCFDKDAKVLSFQDEKGATVVSIPYDKIKSMLYEKTSHPRYAEAILISPFFLFSKTKKHFLTIQYTDPAGAGQFAMIHMDKGNARDIVARAEAETGKKADMAEER
jgi:hypothetical protein